MIYRAKATGGKIQSDGDARKEMLAEFPDGHPLLEAYAKVAPSAEQAFKLYITPYLCLIDPETGKMQS